MNMKRIVCIAGAFFAVIFLIAYNSSDFEKKKQALELKRAMETTVSINEETDIWDVVRKNNQPQETTTVQISSDTMQSVTDTITSETTTSKNIIGKKTDTTTTAPATTEVPNDVTSTEGKKTIFTSPPKTIETTIPQYTIKIQ